MVRATQEKTTQTKSSQTKKHKSGEQASKRHSKKGKSMVYRVYVEKKPGFSVEAQHLCAEIKDVLAFDKLKSIRIVNRYDVEGIGSDLFERCIPCVFSEPQSDNVYRSLDEFTTEDDVLFAVEYLPGQFDQRAQSASECVQLISAGERPAIRSAKVYILDGELSDAEIQSIHKYVINPIEAREASLELPETLSVKHPEPADVEVLRGFCEMSLNELEMFIEDRGLAMDAADVAFCQDYFKNTEHREPTITEIKMIDTYWSDHCRHTTFGTILDSVEFEGDLEQKAYSRYLELRRELGRDEKPICLMDMATIGAKYLQNKGILKNLDESEEVNACTVKVKVDVDGEERDWLYLFKNETHNHPTEVEPFGGAATCIGGAIRDPLSGRAYVYQAMRVTGAANPTTPMSETLPGKLPQRKLTTTAAAGYSSYGNQIGIATGQVCELYHPGFAAKRMEIGAVVAATPAHHVVRETPKPKDAIILLGGKTGRDGIGGATGSSKAHTTESIETCGAEVQKGNAPVERKIQRLFRRGEACKFIKRCNDFGAGGVSVATGEIADGLLIDLDTLPKKYEGLDGTELAISESQERMACAVAPENVDEFLKYAKEENLEATVIAYVTESPRLEMTWRGKNIVNVSREFLNSNGAPKHVNVCVGAPKPYATPWQRREGVLDCEAVAQGSGGQAACAASSQFACAATSNSLHERMCSLLSNLNVACNKGLSERFDSTIGAGSVLMPYGGAFQLTPALAMVSKLPTDGETNTVSGMAWGYNPYLSSANQYAGAYLAVLESICKLVATGFRKEDAYLTFQEYFGKLHKDPKRWGRPVSSLLGALSAQLDLEVGAIGGKDSMSGSFNELDVPPTLVSFATAIGRVENITSPEFKEAGHSFAIVSPVAKDALIPPAEQMRATISFVQQLISSGEVCAVSVVGAAGVAESIFKMCVGNGIGVNLCDIPDEDFLFEPRYVSFIVEFVGDGCIDCCPKNADCVSVRVIGKTKSEYEMCVNYAHVEGESAQSVKLDLGDLQEVWEGVLEGVFPYKHTQSAFDEEDKECETIAFESRVVDSVQGYENQQNGSQQSEIKQSENQQCTRDDSAPAFLHTKPRVIIPVFPGNNCEFDSARAFRRAGASVHTFVINNLTPNAVTQSIEKLTSEINEANIVMIPGGFSGGDEPDGSAKFITAFFRNPSVCEAVRNLLQVRGGLMLGICNGFQALVKLGLVPFGDIVPMSEDCPTLTFNNIGRHQSRLVHTRVCSTMSPWLCNCKVGDVHTLAISHGEGRFVANDETLCEMRKKGQIAFQYCDVCGFPGMGLDVNPNGSTLAIEGITSPCGRVLGKMGHSERAGQGLYKNVPEVVHQNIFDAGVSWFL